MNTINDPPVQRNDNSLINVLETQREADPERELLTKNTLYTTHRSLVGKQTTASLIIQTKQILHLQLRPVTAHL